MCKLDHTKVYDFVFIGSINSNDKNRKWVIDFAEKHFTDNSIFVNTDNPPNWVALGKFDYTNHFAGFCPRHNKDNQCKHVQYRVVQDNIEYFETMCKSTYCLCPAGDAPVEF